MCDTLQWCPTLRPYGQLPPQVLCPQNFPGKNTGVDCHFLLQGIFPTQGSGSVVPPALAGRFFTTAPLGKPNYTLSSKLWGIRYRTSVWPAIKILIYEFHSFEACHLSFCDLSRVSFSLVLVHPHY